MNKLRKPQNDFTMIPNALLRDGDLSLRAKGVYALLFSKPDDWVYIEDVLVRESRDGRDAYRAAVRELADAGWITKRQVRDESGVFSRNEIWLNTAKTPVDWKPVNGESVDGQPVDGFSAPTNKEINKTDENKTDLFPLLPPNNDRGTVETQRGKDAAFEEFWKVYPKKVNKQAALKNWRKARLGFSELHAILDGITKWQQSREWLKENGEFICWPQKFITERRWESPPQQAPMKRENMNASDVSDILFKGLKENGYDQ